jgi:cyclase
VPVIASGGAGDFPQILDAIRIGKADAVLVASLLHDRLTTVREIKQYLESEGVRVR